MADEKKRLDWDAIGAQLRSTRQKAEQLIKEADRLSHISEVDSLKGYYVLHSEEAAWRESTEKVASSLHVLAESLRTEHDRLCEELPLRLRRDLESAGLQVWGESALIIVNGIVHVEFDLPRAEIRINSVLQADLSPPRLVESVRQELDRLKGAFTEPTETLKLLHTAYERETAASGRPFGSQVMTLELLPHLVFLRQKAGFFGNPTASQFREYPLVVFRADLYGLMSKGVTTVAGVKFRWASGSTTKGAVFMLVPSLGRTGHVGRMWFEKSETEV